MRHLRNSVLLLSVCLAAGTVSATSTISASHLVYRGAYLLAAKDKIGQGAALAYAPSRGSWFVVNSRTEDFNVLEIHMPDDRDYPGGPRQPAFSQSSAPRATLLQNWGPRLSTAFGGPIDPKQNDVYGASWDEATSRLYVSFGDFYATPATNDCVVAIDFSSSSPAIQGPWRFGQGTTEFPQHLGYTQFFRAPKSLASVAYKFLASGHEGNTFQNGSWGPGLLLVGEPTATSAAGSVLPAKQAMFWPSVKTKVTFDTGKVKTGIVSSQMLRRDPMYLISGNSTNYLGGSLLWKDVPYGRATVTGGWGNGDDAGHLVAIDEDDVSGLIYFGSYTVGAQWYGAAMQFADDFDADTSSPTGYRSWAGIRAPGSQAYFTSPLFPPDPVKNPKGYVYAHQGGAKGNRQEFVVPAAWFYSMSDVVAAANGTYGPRAGLTPINVDPSSFEVLAAPFTTPDLHPAFPNLQYDDQTLPYTTDSPPHLPKVSGAYYRPSGVAGVQRRIYVRMTSTLGAGNTVVNVFDLQ